MSTLMSNDPIVVLNMPTSNLAILLYAKEVHDAMVGNPSFSKTTVDMATFLADIQAFSDAEGKAASGGKGVVAQRNARKKKVVATLRHLADYVQAEAEAQPTIADALALIASAQGVVSNDSGMMHVAAAYRRPLVAVFGSSDPRHTPPRSPRARIEWLHLECSPCFERTCPLGHTNCLNKLAPVSVFDSLKKAMRLETERPSR